ncbi:MAG: response regulator [Ignavibacteriales bacterium]|nr:response regulator [Ignavibacteriales bacterium]
MADSSLLKVLVVDDEDSFRLSLEIGLKMSNRYLPQSTESAESAIELLQKEKFDIAIIDNYMDGMTGLELLKWMMEHSIDTPVIILTSGASDVVAVEAMRLGAYDYLKKDQVDIDRLSIAIKSVYERYLWRKELKHKKEDERISREKQKDIELLTTFQNTVNSLAQFAESGLSGFSRRLTTHEAQLLELLDDEGKKQCKNIFNELRKEIEVVSAGLKSMHDLSILVAQKLGGISIPFKQDDQSNDK